MGPVDSAPHPRLHPFVGVTLQTSATTAAQFTVGRIVNFAMTGFYIVVVPIYQAECAPKELRGLINSTIQMGDYLRTYSCVTCQSWDAEHTLKRVMADPCRVAVCRSGISPGVLAHYH